LEPYSLPFLSPDVFPACAQIAETAPKNIDASSDNSACAKAAPGVNVPDHKGIYKVGGAVSAPKLIHLVDLNVSDEARHVRFAGVCVVIDR
jgi:hypothetical protein